MLCVVYCALAGAYGAVALSVAAWPWAATQPATVVIITIVGIGALAFATVRIEPWARGMLAYSLVVVPLIAAFIYSLTVKNFFTRG